MAKPELPQAHKIVLDDISHAIGRIMTEQLMDQSVMRIVDISLDAQYSLRRETMQNGDQQDKWYWMVDIKTKDVLACVYVTTITAQDQKLGVCEFPDQYGTCRRSNGTRFAEIIKTVAKNDGTRKHYRIYFDIDMMCTFAQAIFEKLPERSRNVLGDWTGIRRFLEECFIRQNEVIELRGWMRKSTTPPVHFDMHAGGKMYRVARA